MIRQSVSKFVPSNYTPEINTLPAHLKAIDTTLGTAQNPQNKSEVANAAGTTPITTIAAPGDTHHSLSITTTQTSDILIQASMILSHTDAGVKKFTVYAARDGITLLESGALNVDVSPSTEIPIALVIAQADVSAGTYLYTIRIYAEGAPVGVPQAIGGAASIVAIPQGGGGGGMGA